MEKREEISDENFEKIEELSNKVFDIAKKIMLKEDRTIDIDTKEIRKEASELLESVDFNNEIEANRIYSEIILDLNYIDNPNVSILSLRLGQIYMTEQKNVNTNN